MFIGYPSSDQIAHQHRHQGDGQNSGRGHGVGLGESQRREQPSFLTLKREDGNKGEGYNQETEEQRRADFGRRVRDNAPAFVAFKRNIGVIVLPMFDLLVGVLDHDDGRIDHGADGDGDPTQRHDIGIDALAVHDDEGREHTDR